MKKTGFKVKQRKPMKRTPLKAKRKASGQAKVFKAIWDSRPHWCEVCWATIQQPRPENFSHLLPKGAYPELKLDERNIVLKCRDCHNLWHRHGASGLRYSFSWVRIVQLRDELYNERLTASISGKG